MCQHQKSPSTSFRVTDTRNRWTPDKKCDSPNTQPSKATASWSPLGGFLLVISILFAIYLSAAPSLPWPSYFQEHKVLIVLAYTSAGVISAGMGCLPLLLLKTIDSNAQGSSAAIASGVMAMASIELLREGVSCPVENSSMLCLIGVLIGMLLVRVTDSIVDAMGISVGDLKGADARRAVVVLGVMTLHSFAEGIGIGVSFSGAAGEHLGRFIAIAIALHNIPEGMAIGLTMVPRGESVSRATMYSMISSLPQPLLSVPAFLLVEQFVVFLPTGLGLASGAMLWLVVSELVPEALEHISRKRTISLFVIAFIWMWTLGQALHALEQA